VRFGRNREKQKPRSALFASRLRDCGRGDSPEAAPKQERGGKGEMPEMEQGWLRKTTLG
jgi:hypothetical protein